MKAAIRLLVRFIFWFALILVGATALLVAHAYVTGHDPAGASLSQPFAEIFLAGLSSSWLPSVVLGALIALFSALRTLDAPLVALLSLVIAWSILLVAGAFLLGTYPPPATSATLPEARLVRVDHLRLYAVERIGLEVQTLAVHDPERDPGFSVVSEAVIEPQEGSLLAPGDARFPLELGRATDGFPSMVDPPPFLDGIIADIRVTSRLLALANPPETSRLLNLAALSLFLAGSWSLVRLTRWPLFNAAITLGAVRLVFWILPAVHEGILRDVLIAAFDSRALPFASAALVGGIGAGLLALLVFMPTLEEWRREVDHD
ncbi:MAG: hypothetical protein ACOC1I_00095 [Spirochaetota bacterium]